MNRMTCAPTRVLVSVSVCALAAASLLFPEAATGAATTPAPEQRSLAGVTVAVTAYARGLNSPTALTSARDGRGRLFVAERSGVVRIVKSGRLYRKPYLNIRSRVGSSSGEQGLLGLAFSPGFKKNGKLFLTYTARDGALILASVKAKKPGANTTPTSSLKTILRVPHPGATNHNGGSLAFGNDGLLYLGTGDGGRGGDPWHNAQRITSPLGKILRLNVNRSCGKQRYCVPSQNVYRGSASKSKRLVFAVGVRNPWRISVDPASGNIWVADVGQDKYEEVNVVNPAQRRINFGWSCREGNSNFNGGQCADLAGYVGPLVTLCHAEEVPGCTPPLVGESITGGYVYRGKAYLSLVGTYVFADFMTGRVFGYRDGQTKQLASLGYVTSFGESDSRELFAATYSGTIFRVRSS